VRPIATVRAKRGDKGISLFAGLIIARVDRSDIRTFQDLRGKKILAVDKDSLGGWPMAKRELLQNGNNPERDIKTAEPKDCCEQRILSPVTVVMNF
jgi:ABC-type phosphate/phosphonate transport system substrate-binding protein